MKDKVFFPNLDGWRFVAFVAVFYHHSFSTQLDEIRNEPLYQFIKGTTQNGDLGVDFFFVLSGFLIIYLLIDEKKITGKINARNFYIRRILRIFPLYYFCVFFGFFLFPVFKGIFGVASDENANLLPYVFFFANIDIYTNGILPDAGGLGVLWSVAIEEQFYLTIPFILLIVPIRYYKWIFVSVLAISLVFRAQFVDNEYFLKFHTFASMGNLAIGGLIAYYSSLSERFVKFFEDLNPWLIRLNYVAIIAVFFFRSSIFATPSLKIFDTVLIAGLFAVVILEQNYSKKSVFKMKNNRLFSNLGKYTYGLYCLHLIAAVAVLQITPRLGLNDELWEVIFLETPLIFVASLLVAYVSFQYYEKPFLKLKSRFSAFREVNHKEL